MDRNNLANIKDGWLDGQEKQNDGWMDRKNGWMWMDIKNRWMVGWTGKIDDGWMDIQQWMDGWIKNRWMVGWIEKNGWLDGQ